MAKITIKELESLTPNDAGRILREDGNLAGRISVRKDGVSVSFFYRYRWGDQNKEYACGTWLRIPRPSGHLFHEHPATDSTVIRPPIPRSSGHP
jgi:hypothetical protein